MEKIAIFRGHNTPYNTGAVGIKKEDDLINLVAFPLMIKLRSLGYEVIDCTPTTATSTTDSLYRRCKKANDEKVALVVSIHFNAFNKSANGTEVLYVSEPGKKRAILVLNEIVKLGFINRGVKNRTNLYVLNNTDAPCILIECAFCDSKVDMDRFNADKMSDAICMGITGKLPVKVIPKVEVKTIPKIDKNILDLQKICNKLGITDKNGIALIEDGINGALTESAKVKLKLIMQNILS